MILSLISYNFGMLATTGISLLMLLVGNLLCKKIKFLKKYFIPSPVVGGLVFALVSLILYLFNIVEFKFDKTIQTIAMTFFFTSVGYMAGLKDLKKGGVGVIVFLGIASLLIIFQNIIGVSLAVLFNEQKIEGLLVGSIPFTGGHGTATAWGETLETQYNIANATAIGNAAATFGLVAGGLIGGPVARALFKHHHLHGNKENENEIVKEENDGKVDPKKGLIVIIILFACMGISEILQPSFNKVLHLISKNLTLPSYILSMLLATIVRNIQELCFKQEIYHVENDKFGDIALQIFLAIALTTLDLVSLTKISVNAVGMFASALVIQVIFIGLFVYSITYSIMGKDYDAVVICAGHCGFGLGATPTAIANMDTFCKVHGKSKKAYLVVPIVGAMFIDFTNALLISIFISIFA